MSLYDICKQFKYHLTYVYLLTISGYVVAQLYPLATAVAINGVINKNLSAIYLLCICHFTMMILEVSSKMLDTRVFTAMYSKYASTMIHSEHLKKSDPSLIAGRTSLLREYITFFERDIPAALLSVISLVISISAIVFIDFYIGMTCLALLLPATIINFTLLKKSVAFSKGLNNRLEREVIIVQQGKKHHIERHYDALSKWRVKLSDAEAKSYGYLELFVISLFIIALWRISQKEGIEAGYVYAIFAYIWRYVTSMDNIPQILQQMAKLKDISERFKKL